MEAGGVVQSAEAQAGKGEGHDSMIVEGGLAGGLAGGFCCSAEPMRATGCHRPPHIGQTRPSHITKTKNSENITIVSISARMIQPLLIRWVFSAAIVLSLARGCASLAGLSSTRSTTIPQRSSSQSSTDYSNELLNLGIASRSKGELDQAISLFQAATTQDNSNTAAHLELGTVFQRQRNLLEAVASFQRAIELLSQKPPPNDSKYDAQYQVGCVYTDMGYLDEAEAMFQNLLSKKEKTTTKLHSKVQLSLANLLLDGLGKKAEALEIYRASFDAGRPSPITLMAGIVADSMGDHAAALAFYRALAPPDEETALHLATSLARAGDHDGAKELQSRVASHVASSYEYVLSTAVGSNPSTQFFTYDMLQLAFQHCSSPATSSSELENGLILEFGVFHGKTIRMIAAEFPDVPVHGFDTFSGIPEDWHLTKSGSYSTQGALPPAPKNVEYHVGLFSDTLPDFLVAHPDKPIRWMNIDCDLYSSTKDVLDAVWDRVVPGTVIVFDEYVLNPHWKDDEYKAFQEAVDTYGWKYEYLGISLVSQQAVVRII
jgi:tetratricopeptide (TPR) repeat protein